MHYCRSLRFEDRPDYGYLRKLFRELMIKQNLEYNYMFDWITLEDIKKSTIVQEGKSNCLSYLIALIPSQAFVEKKKEGTDSAQDEDSKNELDSKEKDIKKPDKSGFAKNLEGNTPEEEKHKDDNSEEKESEEDNEESEDDRKETAKEDIKNIIKKEEKEEPKQTLLDSFKTSSNTMI